MSELPPSSSSLLTRRARLKASLKRWGPVRTITFVPIGLRALNFLVQRIFRINASTPFSVHYTSQMRCPHGFEIAADVQRLFAKMSQCRLYGNNGIRIEAGVVFGSGLTLISANHADQDLTREVAAGPIVIEADCWLGTNVIVLPGRRIGKGAIIGAGSVVTRDIPPYTVYAGNPARMLRMRNHPDASPN